MYLTLETDYAIRIVYCILKEQKRLDAKTISELTGVSLRFSLKILRKLVAGGLIKSFKGTQGGYEANRSANEINLYDVVKITEGEYCFSKCLSGNTDYICSKVHDGPCQMKKTFQEISQMVVEKLRSTTFATLLQE